MSIVYHYLKEEELIQQDEVRIVSYKGRKGCNTTSIHKKIHIPAHNINEDKGSFTLWLMTLEDLATVSHQEHVMDNDPLYQNYSIVADIQNSKDYSKATFAFHWASNWYPQLFAKCFEGYIYSDSPTNKPYVSDKPIKSAFALDVKGHKAFTAAGRFYFHKAQWLQFAVCWDKEENIFNIYVNGVLVSAANSGTRMTWEQAGGSLYVGNPTFALSELCFYDECLSPQKLERMFLETRTYEDEYFQRSLLKQYSGIGIEKAHVQPDSEWECKLDLSLTEKSHLDEFYVQGDTESPSITAEGLLIKTKLVDDKMYEEDGEKIDPNNMYLWSKKSFEGDLYVEFEFNVKKPNGFSLLLFQATGMQREDFMKDYKLRKSGVMTMVLWDSVRSYNWGYIREMDDVRDDVSSHIIMKNPWIRPLAYQVKKERIQIDRWYKLQFIQEGNRIRGIVDGELMFDILDDPFTNSGPVYSAGHFAIRCMKRTEVLYKNLKIYNKKPFFEVL